jgi:hypothetical protein
MNINKLTGAILVAVSALTLVTVMAKAGTECECNDTEAQYMHIEYEIERTAVVDKEMATRMCEVCGTKIKKYKLQMSDNEMELATLKTYERRLHRFCSIKNGLLVDWGK